MADHEMVVSGGIRYRPEDAKHLELVPDAPAKTTHESEHAHKASHHKTKTAAGHKMRTVKEGGAGGDDDDASSAGES
jgi:hypothetical protein